jgi:hypothetical protein
MDTSASIRRYVKSMPVIGRAASLALEAFNYTVNKAHAELFHSSRRIKHGVAWTLLDNPRSSRLFLAHKPVLTPVQERLVEDLRTKGIAVTTVEDVGLDLRDWTRLRQEVDAFSRSATELIGRASNSSVESLDLGALRHNIDRFKRFFGDPDNAQNDDYIIKMYPENSLFSADNPLIKIGLSHAILNVVNSYFGLWSKLKYTDAWHSMPIPSQRIGSMRWHRDGEDWKMMKVYLNCSNVDEDAGPMEFVPGTNYAATNHPANGPGREICEWKASGANRYASDSIEQRFPSSARLQCSGPIGTLIFCDTAGFHRGGIPRAKSRLLAHWAFVTPASLWEHRFSVSPAEAASLSEEAQFAIRK